MADKQIVDLNDIVQDTASGDFLVIYDLSNTEDKKISFDDLAQKIFDEFGVTATVSELNIMDGVTSTASELNILDGVTADKDELNILDGCKATATELNLLDSGEDESIYESSSQIKFKVGGDEQIYLYNGGLNPTADNDISFGTSSFRFKDINIAGLSLLKGVIALDGTPQDVKATSTLIDAVSSKANITTAAGALGLTISDGNYDGQLKYVYMIIDGGGDATLTGANLAGTSIAMDNVGEGFTLIWDDSQSKWFIIGNNDCTFTA